MVATTKSENPEGATDRCTLFSSEFESLLLLLPRMKAIERQNRERREPFVIVETKRCPSLAPSGLSGLGFRSPRVALAPLATPLATGRRSFGAKREIVSAEDFSFSPSIALDREELKDRGGIAPFGKLALTILFFFLESFIVAGEAQQPIYFYQRGYVAGSEAPASALTDHAVEAFARRRPDIKVAIVGLPWGKEGDLKLRAVLLNRRKIDLFRVTNDQLPDFIPAKGELLSSIDSYLTPDDRADINASAFEAVSHHGKIMAWPLWSTALALLGNTEIMKARGIEPSKGRPWTWEEFSAAIRQATFEAADGTHIWGLTAAARPPLFEWNPLLAANAGPIFLPESVESKEIPFSPNLARALSRVAELRSAGLLAPSFGIDDQPTAWGQFRSGRAAFIVSTPALIRNLAASKFPYIILPPPTGDYGKPITTGALGAFAVVAHAGEPERERASHEFARYLTSAEVEADVPGWYLATPVRRSVTSFRSNPAYAGLAEIAETAVYLNPPGGPGFFEQVMIPKFQAALIGEIEPDKALKEIQEAYERKALK